MKKLKVMTVVGTRPEIIRLARVIARLDRYTEHVLVHTGQNYDHDLNEIFFRELKLRRPAYHLKAAGKSAAQTIGNVLIRIDPVLVRENPDALLVLGDTNSALSVIAAKRRKIPVFHMEAGNRCFDQRVPEELNRTVVDHLSDINLTYSDLAREYLLREGLPPERVIKTGSPLFEVLRHYGPSIERSAILKRLKLKPLDYFLVSCHREENVDDIARLTRFAQLLNRLAEGRGKRVIVSTHPRTRQRIEKAKIRFDAGVELQKPFGYFDYVKLQQNAAAVLSDSGTITEESSILNFPALNIRDVHERPEGMEEGAVMLTGLDPDRVMQALSVLADQPRGSERMLRLVRDYDAPNVSQKVVRLILSYTDYVNRRVWYR